MDRRYQVFVSSTFTDLETERRLVMETLLKAQCLPAGMELFPASSQEQLEVIKRVIDDSDYYVLIVGGRYGSMAAGISYTEQEFDYAVEQVKPVLAFVHENPGSISFDDSEQSAAGRRHLQRFRQKVMTGRMVSFFSNADQLAMRVNWAVERAKSETPGDGWVRGSEIAALQTEINHLKLQVQSNSIAAPQLSDDLATGDDQYMLESNILYESVDSFIFRMEPCSATVVMPVTWNQVLFAVGPALIHESYYPDIAARLGGLALEILSSDRSLWPSDFGKAINASPTTDAYSDVIVQLLAQGLIVRVSRENSNKEWRLSNAGTTAFVNMRAIRREAADTPST